MKTSSTPVIPGQVWADNDPRAAGRTIQIDAVDGDAAACTVLTNDTASQVKIDATELPYRIGKTGRYVAGIWVPGDRRGTRTVIKLARLRPTATGYLLASGPNTIDDLAARITALLDDAPFEGGTIRLDVVDVRQLLAAATR